MADPQSKLMVHKDGDIIIVEFLERNILDESTIQQIGQEITTIIEKSGAPKLLLSFDNVDHLSSAALGTLITINNKVKNKDGQLRLANINKQIYEVFAITKLNKLFKILDNTEKAKHSFKK